MRSFWGPLLGAAVFVVLQDYLSSLTTNWMSFLGAMFVLMVLFFPRGGLLGRACCAAARRHEHCSRSATSPSTSAAWSPCATCR